MNIKVIHLHFLYSVVITILLIVVIYFDYKKSNTQNDTIDYSHKIDSLQAIIDTTNNKIDTLVQIEKQLIIKKQIIIKNQKYEDSIIINTPDSNIISLFSNLSKRLNTKTSK